jgi:hypothetical protein
MATVQNHYHLALATPSFTHYQAAPRDAGHFPVAYTAAGRKRFRAVHRRSRVPVGALAPWAEYVVVWGGRADELARSPRYREIHVRGPLRLFGRVRAARARG